MKDRTRFPLIGAAIALCVGAVIALGPRLRAINSAQSPLQSPLTLSDAEAQAIAQAHALPFDAEKAKQASENAVGTLNAALEAGAPHFAGLWLADAQVNIAVVKSADAISFDARVQVMREIASAHGPLPYRVNFVPADFSFQTLRQAQEKLTRIVFSRSAPGSSGIDVIRNRVTLQSTELLDGQALAAQIGMTNTNPLPFIIENNIQVTPMWRTTPDATSLITKIERVGVLDVLTLSYQGEAILFPRVKQPETNADGAYHLAGFSARELAIVDGCLVGRNDSAVSHIAWPNNVQPVIDETSGKLALINEKGDIVARLGEPFQGGGSEYPKGGNTLALPTCLSRGDSIWGMNPMYRKP
jgi:hypothetical protein